MRHLRERWGRNIAKRRNDLGLTQAQLAAEIGVAQGNVSAWENGLYAPTDRYRVAIAKALGVDPNLLFPLPVEVAK